ncbi:hypothetical protein ES705_49473 [subsurface metagenome]
MKVFKFRRNTIQQPDRKAVDGKKNWGGVRKKEKTQIRNGGVEDAGSFKKNGPILYFSGSLAGQFHLIC